MPKTSPIYYYGHFAVFSLVLFFSSCHTGAYYFNKRIDHSVNMERIAQADTILTVSQSTSPKSTEVVTLHEETTPLVQVEFVEIPANKPNYSLPTTIDKSPEIISIEITQNNYAATPKKETFSIEQEEPENLEEKDNSWIWLLVIVVVCVMIIAGIFITEASGLAAGILVLLALSVLGFLIFGESFFDDFLSETIPTDSPIN